MIKSYKGILCAFFCVLLSLVSNGQCNVSAGNDTTVCQGSSLVRTASTTTNNPQFQWYLSGNSGNSLSTNSSINVNTTASGIFTIVVKVDRNGGGANCPAYDTFRVTVNARPSINAGNNISLCQGATQNITPTYSPLTGSISWFLQGSPVVLNNTAVFPIPTTTSGVFNYVVKIDSASTCSDLDTIRVTVNPKPTASFDYSPNSGCPRRRRKIKFNSTSSSNGGGNLSYQWNFGDPNSGSNNTSNDNDPEHSFVGTGFNNPGTFTVTLTVTTSNGCSATTSQVLSLGTFPDATLIDTVNFTSFATCNAGVSLDLTVNNASTTQATNTNYQINWGDLSPNYSSPTMTNVTHAYPQQGYYTLTFIVSSGGCKDSSDYRVFFGSNPGGSISSPSSTYGCTGQTFSFPFANVASNTPGTEYVIVVNDGTDTVRYTQETLPAVFTHTFDSTSCGTTSNGIPNTFMVTYTISNPCGETPGTIGGIRISKKPKADFSISPKDTVCVNNAVTFTSTGIASAIVPTSGNGACTEGKLVWDITPTTGWTLTSGILGSTNNQVNQNNWTAGSSAIVINFTTPGVYNIRLRSGGGQCGVGDTTKTICVNPTPVGVFTLNNNIGCAPVFSNATNTSNVPNCGQNKYSWTVTYSPTSGCLPAVSDYNFINGTNANSANPQFQFNNPGIYTISLVVISPAAACSSVPVTQTVTVKGKPVVTLPVLNAICQNQSITPSSTTTCYIDAASIYAWTFGGGSPATSNLPNPGSVAFNTSGTQTIALSVTNECGTTAASQTLVVNPNPSVNTVSSQTLCAGAATSPINFSGSTVPNTTYNWTNNNGSIGLASSGAGNIPSFIATNTGNTPIVSTITVTPIANGCSGTPITFTITVNPNPVVTVNGATICSGASATLTASGADTYTWTPTTGLSSGTGSTVTASPTLTTTYTITGTTTLTGCKSTATSNVVVNPSSVISGTLTSNPSNCSSATGSITLQGLIAGVSYQVLYTGPAGLVNINIIANGSGNIIIGNLSAGSYSNITVTSNGCASNAVGPFSLSDPNPPATPTAGSNSPLCSGQTLNLTASTASTGTTTWTWTGPNGFSSNLQNPSIPNASVLATGTYSVTVTINGCTSSAGTTNVVVRETPATPVASSNSPVCSGNPLTLSASTTSTMSVTWSWTGPNTYASSLQNPTVSNAATVAMSGTYTVVATANYTTPNVTCPSSPASTIVDVRPTPNISASSSTNPTNCASGTGSITLSGLTSGQTYQVQYTGPTGPVTVSLVANASGNIEISGLAAGAYTNVSVTLNGCPSNAVGPFTLVDPTPPVTPVIGNIAPICSGSTLNLSATTTTPGTATWNWTGPNGFTSNVSNPSIPNAGINYDGTYNVTVTINGCTSPAASATVIIKETPATPIANSNSPVCSGNTLSLSASTTSTMPVTWNWTGPSSYSSTNQNPTVSNAATTVMSGVYIVAATATYTTPAIVCPSSTSSTSVVVNPTPVISGSSFTNPTNCASSTGSITLNGLANNTSYEVHYTNPSGTAVVTNISSGATGSLVINNLPQGTYSNVYVVLSNCPSSPVGPFVLVDPNPPATPVATTNAPICAGTNLTLSVSAPVAGGTYSWVGPNGYTATGTNVNIPNSTVTMSGNYSVTVTLNSCTSPAGTVSVVINPIPPAPIVSTPVIYCQFSTSTALTATPLAGHTLLWYANSSGGAGVPQAPTPSTADAGNFSVFVSQVSAEGCEGARAELVIIVNPTPVVSPQSATICSGATFNISPSGTTVPAGTLYSWSTPVVTGGLTGGVALADQASISGTLSNPGDFVETATYTIVPKTGNCPGNSFQTIITVNPAPRVSFSPAPQTICSGQTTQLVTLTSPTPGVNIPWVAQIPAGISGGITSGTNTIAAATLVNNTSASLTVVYAAVAITNGAAGCPGDTSRYNVVVNPKPNIPAQAITVCSREAFAFAPTNNPPSTIVPPGTTYTWTFTDNVNVTGESSSAVSSDSIRQQLVNLTNQTQTVVYQVTPTSGSAGSCGGPMFTFTVTIEPRAEIPVLVDTICSGTSFTATPTNGQPNATTIVPPGTLYSWNAPNPIPGIGGLASGNNQSNISGALTNSTFAPITITYVVGTQSGSCIGDSFLVKITVNPLASISNNPLSQSVCNGGTTTAINWTSFTAGANYSWTIQSSGSVTGFIPAGNGNTLSTMTLTNTGIAQDSVVYLVSSTASACAGPATPYTIYVNPDAFANISYPYDTACWPYSLVINNTSPRSPGNVNIPNGQYDWYSIAPNGNQTFLGSGTNFPGYTIPGPSDSIKIKLVAISAFGCKNDSITHTFFTRPKPAADFDMTNRDSCGPITVAFTNQTNLQDTFNFQWNFGNGQTSTLVNPAPVTYVSSPNFYDTTYYVTLTVFNECDTSVYIDSVIVRANPKARFSVSSSSGCSPFLIQITNSSLGNPHTYYWDYGNGVRDTTNATGVSTYTYYTGVVDTFDLMLIAESNCGRDTQIIKIRVAPNVINPGVSINATELYGCVSHAVNFINTTTGATTFSWNFGDGTPIATTNLFQTIVTHVYNTSGTFTVEIDMTNGCSDTSITKEVTVYPAPLASFTASPTQCQGDTTRFNNLSTQSSNYSWSFGNGAISTLANPVYVFPAPGIYTVELVAQQSSPQGLVCADSVSQNITIVAKPDTGIITNIGLANCAPFNMNASIPSYTNEIVTWYVYDTTLAVYPIVISNPTLNYTFNQSGVFEVIMVIENAAGCKDSVRRNLIVYAKPVAGFTPLNLVTCNLDTLVSYVNTTTANNFTPLRYRWFVDGIQRATSGNFTYRYNSLPTDVLPRIFNTKLVATNSVGCADSIVGTLQMNPTAKSIFTVNNQNDCIPFNVNIVNNSTYATVHQWYLNGVLVSTDANPVIQITNSNTNYTIQHIASNQYACKSDTSRYTFTSRVMPKAIFRVSDTLGCNGQLNVVTVNNSQNATSYDWDWGDGTANSTLVNPTHLYTSIGTYRITLTAKDAVCRDTTSKIVKVSQRPTASFVADNTRTCDTAIVRMINLTTNATQYYWTLNNGMTSTAVSPVFSLPPSATNYSVTLLAINGDGCRDSLTRANYINVIAPPPGDFTVTPSQVQSIPNYSFGFTNLTPDRVMYNYTWSLGDGTFANTRDVISHQYADTGSYEVQMIVVDTITSCTDTVVKVVRIEGYPGYLYVPNAFYPNSNQIQFRSFKPVGKGLQDYELQIFDSWGKLLFRTTKLDAAGSPVESWDGNYKGAPMPQDAYAWRIKAKYRNGRAWEGMKYDKNENGLPAHTFGTLTLFR